MCVVWSVEGRVCGRSVEGRVCVVWSVEGHVCGRSVEGHVCGVHEVVGMSNCIIFVESVCVFVKERVSRFLL